jgi:uncharacterized protein
MLNFIVDPALLQRLVPAGTDLDTWERRTFVSLVGFQFIDTRILGVPVPAHRSFEEVNLRFYVRRNVDGEVRRGVTFIRELVPRFAIAAAARGIYNEPYRVVPMRHRFGAPRSDGAPESIEYAWKKRSEWVRINCAPVAEGVLPAEESHEKFITERSWGYTRQRDGGTIEYEVTHPRWHVWPLRAHMIIGNLEPTYGESFASLMRRPAPSAFFADGSRVTVSAPTRLRT